MTTVTRMRSGVADHIGKYADAGSVSACYTQNFVSGTPGYVKVTPCLTLASGSTEHGGPVSESNSATRSPRVRGGVCLAAVACATKWLDISRSRTRERGAPC